MKLIKLSQGYKAQVSDKDYVRCMKGPKWCALPQFRKDGTLRTVYAVRSIYNRGKRVGQRLHRFILGLINPAIWVDHKDGNGLNCQRYNIHVATPRQNCQNKHTNMRNTSGFQGVSWWEPLQRWRVCIRNESTSVHLGYFNDKIKAAKEYDKAARKLYGKHARTNF